MKVKRHLTEILHFIHNFYKQIISSRALHRKIYLGAQAAFFHGILNKSRYISRASTFIRPGFIDIRNDRNGIRNPPNAQKW